MQSVFEIPAAADLADCVFIEDAAVSIGRKVLITRPGAASRQGEVNELVRTFSSNREILQPWSVVRMEDEGARLDGGDVILTDSHCFVGLSSRTNRAGLACLQRLLGDQLAAGHKNIIAVEVIDDLHLKSLATHAGNAHLAVDESRGGRHFVACLEKALGREHGYRLHYMPDHAAANVLRIGHQLWVAAGCGRQPEVQALARAAGVHVTPDLTAQWHVRDGDKEQEEVVCEYGGLIEVPNSEFAKADGALTCRSVILNRGDTMSL